MCLFLSETFMPTPYTISPTLNYNFHTLMQLYAFSPKPLNLKLAFNPDPCI